VQRFVKVIAGGLAVVVIAMAAFVAVNWVPDLPVAALKARWAAPPSAFVSVAGMDVHVRDEGPRDDPMPIVLLHGTSSSLHTWEGWARELTNEHRVVRFDLPGFGLTGPAPGNIYGIGSYAGFVLAMLDRLGVEHCVLGGNSFGGYVAWVTALGSPQRVDKLILVDAAGYRQQSTSVPIGFRIARWPVFNRLVRFILPRSVIASSLRNVYGDPAKVTPQLVDLYFAMAIREGNRRALVERMAQAPPQEMSARIRELRLPTLILWGGRDHLIPPENAQRFHRDIPSSRLVVFAALGHVPHEEDPHLTVGAVKAFLAGG
jgi:pimeloyl-ACP methyl ester carboxylesterase